MTPPHILLVTADQQRFDTCGPRAPRWLRTPHVDHLCRDGIRFDRAYADCPLCVPSRLSIMTGKTVFAHGAATNVLTSHVMGSSDTLPALLGQVGYRTCAVGKMHFGPQREAHGFAEMALPQDYYDEIETAAHPYRPMRHGLGQNELYPAMATVPESLTLTSWIAEHCVQTIRSHDPRNPLFLWCSFPKPHPPFDPPEPYYSMYRDCPIPDPVHGDWSADERCHEPMKRFRQSHSYDLLSPEVIRAARAAYYGLITHNDYAMGRVFGALNDAGLWGDTLILFTSDHGEYLGDHRMGQKGFFHEPSAHVPMVLRLPHRWPGRQVGAVASHLVTMADILPTLVGAAGGTIPACVDGLDLLTGRRDYLMATGPYEHYSLTDGRWKYLYFPEGAAEQLFDLDTDPDELTDLSASSPRTATLRAELVRRLAAQRSAAVVEGRLASRPVHHEPEHERRAKAGPAYHTEAWQEDARH